MKQKLFESIIFIVNKSFLFFFTLVGRGENWCQVAQLQVEIPVKTSWNNQIATKPKERGSWTNDPNAIGYFDGSAAIASLV